MPIPEFNDNGDLPPGIYSVTLTEVIACFSSANPARRIVGNRLERVYNVAKSTGHLARLIVYGSFVTEKG